MEMNSLPRWLISITDIPLPRQSSISSAACRKTGSGSVAGPALKLKTRVIVRSPGKVRLARARMGRGAGRYRIDRAPTIVSCASPVQIVVFCSPRSEVGPEPVDGRAGCGPEFVEIGIEVPAPGHDQP